MPKLRKVTLSSAVRERQTATAAVMDRASGMAAPQCVPVIGAVQLAKSSPLQKAVVRPSALRKNRKEAERRALAKATESDRREPQSSIPELCEKGVLVPTATSRNTVQRGFKREKQEFSGVAANGNAVSGKSADKKKNTSQKHRLAPFERYLPPGTLIPSESEGEGSEGAAPLEPYPPLAITWTPASETFTLGEASDGVQFGLTRSTRRWPGNNGAPRLSYHYTLTQVGKGVLGHFSLISKAKQFARDGAIEVAKKSPGKKKSKPPLPPPNPKDSFEKHFSVVGGGLPGLGKKR